jgi:hypothetical protein
MTQRNAPSTGCLGRILRGGTVRWLRDFRDGHASDQVKQFTFTLSPNQTGHNNLSPNSHFREATVRVREDPEHPGEMLVEVFGRARLLRARGVPDDRRREPRWPRDERGRWLPGPAGPRR